MTVPANILEESHMHMCFLEVWLKSSMNKTIIRFSIPINTGQRLWM